MRDGDASLFLDVGIAGKIGSARGETFSNPFSTW
jgi:hypothetical protein